MTAVRVGVVGAAGYIGGELLRLLLNHPMVEVVAATSQRRAGRRVDTVHPNLRARTELAFVAPEDLPPCDALMLAVPHGSAADLVAAHDDVAFIADLSADFRLRDLTEYADRYGRDHPHPSLIDIFVPGLPELHRDELRAATRVSVPGCMATAAILALHPLARAGLIEPAVRVDARTGSSGSGTSAEDGSGSSHAERASALRVFAPLGHRHEAEIDQATGLHTSMSATGVQAVRGVQVVCQATAREAVDDRTVRAAYRDAYADEPFVRIVAHRRGLHRYPDPSVLFGSNYADVGFSVAAERRTVIAMAALDNLVKGGAGSAVQCLNIAQGWAEDAGLEFSGLHPL